MLHEIYYGFLDKMGSNIAADSQIVLDREQQGLFRTVATVRIAPSLSCLINLRISGYGFSLLVVSQNHRQSVFAGTDDHHF